MNNPKNKYFKFIFIIAIFLIIFLFSLTCYKKEVPEKETEIKTVCLNAKIIGFEQDSILVQVKNEFTVIRVYTDQINYKLIAGDWVQIQYNGEIKETNPPRITALSIKVE